MKLISLSAAVHIMPPGAEQPIAVIAIFGTTVPGDEQFVRVAAVAAATVRGGLLRFSQPVKIVLAARAVAGMQKTELSAKQPEPAGQ